jgi:adenylate cyclase
MLVDMFWIFAFLVDAGESPVEGNCLRCRQADSVSLYQGGFTTGSQPTSPLLDRPVRVMNDQQSQKGNRMDNKDSAREDMVEGFWHTYFMEGPPRGKVLKQRFYKSLPARSRCKFCFAPFDGTGGAVIKTIFQVYPSRFNPHYCNVCDDFAKKYQGGAEVPVTMLFADIRGSTTLAEKIEPRALSGLINRFYVKSTYVLSHAGAMIEKLAGDEITAVFAPGLAGEAYARQAVDAARELLRETGHADEGGPWVPVGIGLHSGVAFVGSVGRPGGNMEVAALGDVPNTTSRLTSQAGPGEILVSEETLRLAGVDTQGLERRQLALKGRSEPIDAFVLHV